MAILASCWIIIESIVIPDGYYLKWFYLSFYIHPILLLFCQIFLWLKLLKRCVLAVFTYPFRIIYPLGLYVYKFCRYCMIYIFSSITPASNLGLVKSVHNNNIISQNNDQVLISLSFCSSKPQIVLCKTKLVELDQRDEFEDWSIFLHKDLSMDDCSSSTFYISSPSMDEAYLNEYSPLFSSIREECSLPAALGSQALEREEVIITTSRDEDEDEDEDESEEFYRKYSGKMAWFDALNHDRTCGINAILNKDAGRIPSSLEDVDSKNFSIPYISWSKMDKKKLLRSLKCDFELVYVAQSCLTWEALHHQYRKVKFLSFSKTLFSDNEAGDFQHFQTLIERFLEEENYCYKGKRAWNYVQARLASKSLLQVPKVTGFKEEENEEIKEKRMHAKGMLKAIDNCIQAFEKFVTTDRKKSWWKFKSSLCTYSPVEDPRDLDLLADLTRELQKKELWVKNLLGKQRCWLNKAVNPVEESQKETMLFAIIDMKLVSRVLQMSIVSSSQLKWCQQKLKTIEFKRGRLFRIRSGPLFPSS